MVPSRMQRREAAGEGRSARWGGHRRAGRAPRLNPLVVADRRCAAEVLDALDVVVWLADADSLRISLVSERAERLLGHPLEEWLAPHGFWERHSHPDERASLLGRFREVADKGRPAVVVHRLITSDGRERWFRTSLRRLPKDLGSRAQVLGLMLDITERRLVEASLAAPDPVQRMLLGQVPAILWTVSRELRITSGAGAGMAALGLKGDGILYGVSLAEYFQTSDPDYSDIVAHRRALAGETMRYETTWVGRSYDVQLEPLRAGDGEIQGVIGLAIDITERKRLEAEGQRLLAAEREARAAAERAVKARDEFLSIASHELRTPMTSLCLVVQSLLRRSRASGPPGLVEALELADGQGRRMVALIEQLLDVARMRAEAFVLTPAPCELVAVARAVIERSAPALTASGSDLRLVADGPIAGTWDCSRLEQVAENLLSNAIRYGLGRPIEVRVEGLPAGGRLSVCDQGIGIPSERLRSVFDPFERAVDGRQYGGLGLGLFIVRRIVEAHGGTVAVDSRLGEGACFTVELPPAPPDGPDGRAGGAR
jgi:PAS domain S-box-containing protein